MINSSLKALGAMLASKQISSVEMTKEFLKRIDQHNPDINAYITLDHERSLAQAAAADARIAAGQAGGSGFGSVSSRTTPVLEPRLRRRAGPEAQKRKGRPEGRPGYSEATRRPRWVWIYGVSFASQGQCVTRRAPPPCGTAGPHGRSGHPDGQSH